LSAADIAPSATSVAFVIPIAGAVPPLDVIGAVPVTLATAAPGEIPSSFAWFGPVMKPLTPGVPAIRASPGSVR
jgi:hypothetical protein